MDIISDEVPDLVIGPTKFRCAPLMVGLTTYKLFELFSSRLLAIALFPDFLIPNFTMHYELCTMHFEVKLAKLH